MNKYDNIRIIFMGTPEFALPSLKALIEKGFNVTHVVTQPDRPKGRGRKPHPPPVKKLALQYKLPILQPENASDKGFIDFLKQNRPDLIIVVAYGQILKKELLNIPSFYAINVHPSLLPKYRGAAPIQWTIINDDSITGVTIIKMNERMDAGPILLQKEVQILPDETAGQLHSRLSEIGADLLLAAINKIIDGSIEEVPQDESKVTYAPKIERSMSNIKWKDSAKHISAKIRAFDPWPGAVTNIKGKSLKLFSSAILDNNYTGEPGRIYGFNKDGIIIETCKGLIIVRELQAAGKRRLPAYEFLKGFPLKKGERFF